MKKLLLFASAALMSISASAQFLDAKSSKEILPEVLDESSRYSISADQTRLMRPMRTKANGVYYTIPSGLLYRGQFLTDGVTPSAWSGYANMGMYVAPFHTYHFENMCVDPTAAQWALINSSGTVTSIDEKYPEYIDEGHNLNYSFGNPSFTGTKVIPTILVGDVQWKWGTYKDDEAETEIGKTSYIYVRPSVIPLTYVPTQMYSHYAGWTNNDEDKAERPVRYAHGTGAYFTLKDDENKYVATNAMQFFPAPATPLYFESIRCNVFSYAETPIPEGKQLYAKIYKAKLVEGETDIANCWNYEIVDEENPIAVLSTDMSSAYGEETNSKGYKTFSIVFENKQIDAFGNEYSEPVVVDDIFCVEITGFDEEGVDVGFQMYNALTKTDFPRTIVDCRLQGGETKDIVKHIGANRGIMINFDGMLDNAKVYTEGSYYTDDTKTETEMRYELNKFQIADDGEKLLSNGTLSSARVYTALNWADEDGNENYYLGDDNDEIPEWITEYEVDNSSWASNYYSKIAFAAQPLPEGVAGRMVKLYVKSDKGAVSENPIILYQGDYEAAVGAGVETVTLVKEKNSAIYNIMGQKVSRAQQGVFVKNGKKFIVK